LILYREMNRLAKGLVTIQDYNKNRNGITSLIEWMEGGDYFHFIQSGKEEMEEVFKSVEVIDVDIRASWYLCKPKISH
ncbi:MAG: class I SAM-dependent methyltransferase, partial [Gallicola sp.]|nr:class I SAM-dependent methyltransferase [Gallicola sp.]